MSGVEVWFRYSVRDGEDGPVLILSTYPVARRTAKGVWLLLPFGSGERFVLSSARKRFAYPTMQQAMESMRARSARRIEILRAQLALAQRAASEVEKVWREGQKQG